MIIKRTFLSLLEGLAKSADKKFPNQKGVGIEVVRINNSPNIKAEVYFGWDDQDLVELHFTKDGRIIDEGNQSMKPLTEEEARELLLGEMESLLKKRIPGTKEKLEYLIKGLD